MYLEEETSKKSEVISCIFSLKEEVGALAKALKLFEVTWRTHFRSPHPGQHTNTRLVFANQTGANTTKAV